MIVVNAIHLDWLLLSVGAVIEMITENFKIKYVCSDCKHKWCSEWIPMCPKCGSDNIKWRR